MKELTIEEIKTILQLSEYVQECMADILNKKAKLIDLKTRIIGFGSGFYSTPVTFTRENLIKAFNELCDETDFLEKIKEKSNEKDTHEKH